MPLYAHTTNGTVDQVGTPPATAYAEGRWWDLRTLDPAALTATSWVEVTEVARPADTPTNTSDMSWTLTDGKAVQTWTTRAKTTTELAADQAAADRDATRAAVKLIITDLQAEKTRCDAVIAKTNATITGADTKDVARAGKRIADAAIELARFVQNS